MPDLHSLVTAPAALAVALSQPGRYGLRYRSASLPAVAPITLNVYRPAAWQAGSPIVLVQHGVLRNGEDYRDYWIEAAERYQLLIIAPTFSEHDWPDVPSYNNGNVLVPASVHQPEAGAAFTARDHWSYSVLPQLAADLRTAQLLSGQALYLFGHSAGGQFVHRLLSALQPTDFTAIAAGNPGWYTLPLLDRLFPEGLGGLGLDDAALARVLAYPLQILAGEADSDPDDQYLPREPEAMRQGPHRFARARFYYDTARQEATRRGIPCNWTLLPVAHIGHDGRAMSAVCAQLWFGNGMPDDGTLARLSGARTA